MEEIVFKSGDDSISFRAAPMSILAWPVPRLGEYVEVRGASDGEVRSLHGVVGKVDYYYSIGNNGPVVTVILNL